MTVRFYSSTSPEKALVGSITSGQTTLQVSNTIGLPGSFPYTLAVDYQGPTEELVEVSSAAGPVLTVIRAIDGTSGASHADNARVRHVSSARDFADSRNHENSSTNIHGLTGGEEIVGTNKVQTLSNKTVVNLQGTLLNPDWTNVPAHAVTQTTTPAAGGTVIVFRMINGTDQHVEWKGNGNLNIRNNATLDGQTTARRMQFTMADGTTERLYITTAGTVVSIPRTGTADSNGGLTVLDPGDSVTRRDIQIRDSTDTTTRFVVFGSGNTNIISTDPASALLNLRSAPAQAAPYFRVHDNASNVQMQVDLNGMTEMRKKAFITNDTAPGAVVETVRGTTLQTADLTQWQNVGGANVAHVRADGSSDFSNLVTASGVVVAATGWSISSQVAVNKAGNLTLNISFTRTGGGIVADGFGNIVDTPVATIAAPFRPAAALNVNSLTYAGTTGLGTGSLRINQATGDVTLVTWSTNGTLNTAEVLQMTLGYPVDFA